MNINVMLEDSLNKDQEVTVSEIHCNIGDKIKVGDSLIDYETDKANVEFIADFEGIIESININIGDIITSTSTLFTIKTSTDSDPQLATKNNAITHTPITLGDALHEDQQVTIVDLYVNTDDSVKAGDPLLTYETDKANVEFTANIAGVIEHIDVNVGDAVSSDSIIMTIKTSNFPAQQPRLTNTSIVLGDALTENQHVSIAHIYFNMGDSIKIGEPLLEYETDKASVEFTSPAEGTIENINIKVGDSVDSQTIIAEISTEAQSQTVAKSSLAEINVEQTELEADITIIGGGPGGYVAAIKAAQMGNKVVVVEKEKLGGTCLNWGCIPTKALVRSAEVLELLKESEEFGCFTHDVSFDMTKVMARKNKIVKQLVDGISFLFSKHEITSINGSANIADANTIVVKNSSADITITTKNIIIATGSVPVNLAIPGADLEHVIDSKEALTLVELPKQMVIVGGGVIGMEFAFIFASFGVDVSVVEYADSCLINCDQDVRAEINQAATSKGIKLYTGAKVEEIIKTEMNGCMVAFTQNGEKKYISTEKVLMAVGRTPYSEGVGVEEMGIELNANGRGIKVNNQMQTNIPNIYAIGDVTNIIQLAHVASHQGIVAVNNINGNKSAMDYDAVPSAIFTHPEIGMVGMTEESAREKQRDIKVGKFPFVANGKALALGDSRGFIKIIADSKSDTVLGASIVGANATDMIAELTLAVNNGLTTEQITETIHAHPTTAEVVHEAALTFHGGSIHF